MVRSNTSDQQTTLTHLINRMSGNPSLPEMVNYDPFPTVKGMFAIFNVQLREFEKAKTLQGWLGLSPLPPWVMAEH